MSSVSHLLFSATILRPLQVMRSSERAPCEGPGRNGICISFWDQTLHFCWKPLHDENA